MDLDMPTYYRGYRILILDDNAVFLNAAADLLGRYFDTVIAMTTNHKRALEIAGEYQPDLILVDLDLPESMGLHCISQLKQISPSSRVIAMSMLDESTSQVAAALSGADGLFNKCHMEDHLIPSILFAQR